MTPFGHKWVFLQTNLSKSACPLIKTLPEFAKMRTMEEMQMFPPRPINHCRSPNQGPQHNVTINLHHADETNQRRSFSSTLSTPELDLMEFNRIQGQYCATCQNARTKGMCTVPEFQKAVQLRLWLF